MLRAVALRLAAAGVEWRLAGGAARMLRGLPARPSDIDIEVAQADADRAAAALGLPPPRQSSGGGWWSLRTQGGLAGVPIDLSGGLRVTGPGGALAGMDAPVERVTVTGVPDGVSLVVEGESVARAGVAGNQERRAKALAELPDDDAARAAALAYAESRLAEAARAAR